MQIGAERLRSSDMCHAIQERAAMVVHNLFAAP